MSTEIEELAKAICKPCRRDNETNINCICAEPPCSGARNIAKDIIEAGYHKNVWHKVADGDLPTKSDLYLCVCGKPNGMYWSLVNYIDDGFYNVRDNYNEIDVIAWTEVSEYKE